jgi:hypothetical protein
MKKPDQDLAKELHKHLTSSVKVNTDSSVYKGAARIGTDKDELATADETKLTLVQEASLTPEERKVFKFVLRGFTVGTIAKVLAKDRDYVSTIKSNIKTKLTRAGENIDQAHLVGYTVSIFEEVEEKAWEMYYTAPTDAKNSQRDKNKALELVMKAREKQVKLLMDVGLIQKADNTVTHEVTMSPFLAQWDNNSRQTIVKEMVERTLDKLADPVAPDDEYVGKADEKTTAEENS